MATCVSILSICAFDATPLPPGLQRFRRQHRGLVRRRYASSTRPTSQQHRGLGSSIEVSLDDATPLPPVRYLAAGPHANSRKRRQLGETLARELRPAPSLQHRPPAEALALRQYLYFCTSKASKLSNCTCSCSIFLRAVSALLCASSYCGSSNSAAS